MATILVVDDDTGVRNLLRAALEAAGYEVMEAASGRSALAACRERHADLVITDLLMSDMNGLDTIIALTREFLNVRVLAMSGVCPEAGLLNTARLLGAREILYKPFDLQQMLKAVQYELAH